MTREEAEALEGVLNVAKGIPPLQFTFMEIGEIDEAAERAVLVAMPIDGILMGCRVQLTNNSYAIQSILEATKRCLRLFAESKKAS